MSHYCMRTDVIHPTHSPRPSRPPPPSPSHGARQDDVISTSDRMTLLRGIRRDDVAYYTAPLLYLPILYQRDCEIIHHITSDHITWHRMSFRLIATYHVVCANVSCHILSHLQWYNAMVCLKPCVRSGDMGCGGMTRDKTISLTILNNTATHCALVQDDSSTR